ncbi:MAG: exodeoxyribonuclease V subunit beta [Burkholderiaceae bacterium]|nr:exodeoxyribonuclease V subunit beta [Burkholderiaceae bacterium]
MTTRLDGHPVLDPEIFDGFSLLEADAGTGKTWTLANLVLRALLERDVSIEEIVVVTFTRKAAAELRDRILRAIGSLEAALAGEKVEDVFIEAYLPRCEPKRDLPRLRQACALFDEAPISTIHGLCQRILAEHSLSMGRPFDAEMRDVDPAYVEAAVQRWWRHVLRDGDEWMVEVLLAGGNTAARLASGLHGLLAADDRALAPAPIHRADYAAELRRLADAARAALRDERDGFAAWLLSTDGINRRSYTRARVPEWLDRTGEWLDRLPSSLSDRRKRPDDRLPRERLAASAFSADPAAPQPPFALPGLLDELDALVVRRAGLRAGLLEELREVVGHELALRKREEGVQTYDDLLRLTRDALREPQRGQALAGRLRRRYPIVFVDECQDTDPCQWEILRLLHAPTFEAESDPRLSLVLVGDPKQSIYSFRNADVFAYIAARGQARRQLRLGDNQRASDELVAGLNLLFAAPDVFVLPDIRFAPAGIGSRPRDRWQAPPGDDRRALNLVEIEAGSLVPDIEAAALGFMVREIARLLAGAGGTIVAPDAGRRVPRARDIAVLVRSADEGGKAKQALRAHGIGAVEITRDSVFATRDAGELLRIIDAIADPASASAMRSAMLTAAIGFDAPALEALALDPAEWSRHVESFARAAGAWRYLGPVAALRRLLFHDFEAAARLAADRDAERRLTNLLHLLELLGEMPEAREEAAQARAALADRIARSADGKDESAELRLESDDDLVQILTMHKSKGLEFPIVFVPFGWRDIRKSKTEDAAALHEPDGEGGWRTVLLCGPRADGEGAAIGAMRQRARQEEESEAMRLVYVAATRAEHRLYLFWSASKGDGQVGRLLGASQADRVAEMVRKAPQAVAGLGCMPEPREAASDDAPLRRRAEELRAREFTGEIATPWEERSYTALMRAIRPDAVDALAPLPPAEAPRPDHDEWIVVPVDPDEPPSGEQAVRHAFPAGARAGTALHAVLEEVDFGRPVDPELVARVLGRHGITADARAVADWLDRVLDTPLPDGAGAMPRLRGLGKAGFTRELKFILPAIGSNAVDRTRRIVGIVRKEFAIDGELASNADWHGYLGGFIDLVFEADGRYWILDWKSNRLGGDDSSYHEQAMAASIASHGYALQFCLYTLALHRLLASRLPGYDYERHFGGVYYAFLRGMTGAAGKGVHFARPSRELVVALDAQLSGTAGGGD